MNTDPKSIPRLTALASIVAVLLSPVTLAEESKLDPDAAAEYLSHHIVDPNPIHTPSERKEEDSGGALSIWKNDEGSFFTGTLKAITGYFGQNNSWYGRSEENLGGRSSGWWEWVVHPGLETKFVFNGGSEFYGRLSGVGATSSGLDAGGSNLDSDNTGSDMRVEDAYIGWRSGSLFADIDENFLDISVGRQSYAAGTGFLFYSQSSNGGDRGAYWIGERHAADFSALVRFTVGGFQGDLIYFEADDSSDARNEVSGITLDYNFKRGGSIGGGYYNLSADDALRDGMDVYDIRFVFKPFEAFSDVEYMNSFTIEGEYVYEENSNLLEANGWYLSAGYSWDNAAWTPSLSYRYAAFEGDDPNTEIVEDFDPLYYGFNDWGTWYQGEILGEYVLANSNLNSHMVRLNLAPTDTLMLNLLYFNFMVDEPQSFGVTNDNFADEFNLAIDWLTNDNLSFSAVFAYTNPNEGAKQYTGGDDGWFYTMLYAQFEY
ncbi:hypothetical protein [Ferrimonas gelatinilytica]|uniref:Alginate export domain-containing protein n=1 Tax=Ferrimonas gelatinilytica TaxID=1255257 RepID=A0ABP9S051_9GAMM